MSTEDNRHIPIDIHLSQLLEWLISRRHCTKDWHAGLQRIREKLASLYPQVWETDAVAEAVRDTGLPPTASDLNYLVSRRLMDVLAETELGGKNMLGQYQSPVIKGLAEVLKMYEKDNIYLAELAQILYRKVTYDIPFTKKQMAKLEQTSAEYAKKVDDCNRTAVDFRDQYFKECAVLGIQGNNVRDELLQGAKVLPLLYENIARRALILAPVCEFVEEFVGNVHKGGRIKDQSGPVIFPLLHHIMKHGNVAYPFEEQRQSSAAENKSANVDVMNTAPHIVQDEDAESSQASLDVNLNDTVADHLNELDTSLVEQTIDFDVLDSAEKEDDVDWDVETAGLTIVLEDSGDSVYRNILDNPELRTQVINELHELAAFLQRRLEEQSTDHMASDLLNIQLGDTQLLNNKKTVSQMTQSVRELLELFDDQRLQALCKLHDSATYLERLTKQLEQKLTFASRTEYRGDLHKIHRSEALAQRQNLDPELADLIENGKRIQEFVEHDISKKYQDRRVNILGGIQAVL